MVRRREMVTAGKPPGEALLEATEGWSSKAPVVETSETDWTNYGIALGRVERLVGWEVGDWWNRGEKYLNRVAIVNDPNWTGPSYQTCRNAGSVAAKFPLSQRRDKLTFSHHLAVAAEPPQDANRILDTVEQKLKETGEPLSTRDVKQIIKRERREQRELDLSIVTAAASEKIGHKLYGVVYADPPWNFEPYSQESGMDRSAENHYGCMDTDDICALIPPAAKDAVLFLWRTAPMNEDALKVMKAWGFQYKSEWIWGKNKPGTGYWGRNQHEVLMIGTRGKPVAPSQGKQPSSLQMEPVGGHSEKPVIFHRLIERLFPNTERLDMFARKYHKGWDAFGNEVPAQFAQAG